MTDAAEQILLRDIAHPFAATAAGDIASVAGVANLRAAIYRRLTAMPGSIPHRPQYGAGCQEFCNKLGTVANRQALVNRVKQHLARERRIDEVLSVSVGSWADGQIEITIAVRAIGTIRDLDFVIGGD